MNTLWFLDRASGFVLLVLFTISIIMGILATRRSSRSSFSRLLSQDLHVRITSIALALLVVHVATAVMDSYVDIVPIDVIVPFRGGYEVFWLGLGTIAVDVILVVLITTFIRGRLSERSWRIFHVLAYAGWAACLLHAWGTGSDARTSWGLAIVLTCTLAGLVATVARIVMVVKGHNDVPTPTVAGHGASKGEVTVS
jgi:methionine sulfoxide reductase heme-binding subunit